MVRDMSQRLILTLTRVASMVIATGPTTGADSSFEPSSGPIYPEVSSSPSLTLDGGSTAVTGRLHSAIQRYVDAGLLLPDLHVVLSTDEADCHGAKGYFTADSSPWQITLCTDDLGIVVEHELAHAWERATVDEALRESFMTYAGYTEWRSHDVPWNERAVERIAVVIQQGVAGLPLPLALGEEARGRLEAFELLTSRPDPRLADWLGSRDVACANRPTALSESIPDASGLTCDVG